MNHDDLILITERQPALPTSYIRASTETKLSANKQLWLAIKSQSMIPITVQLRTREVGSSSKATELVQHNASTDIKGEQGPNDSKTDNYIVNVSYWREIDGHNVSDLSWDINHIMCKNWCYQRVRIWIISVNCTMSWITCTDLSNADTIGGCKDSKY